MKKKIFLLVCCAPDASYSAEFLKNLGYEVITYFYNPCIHPQEEYEKRKAAMETLAEKTGIKNIDNPVYDPERFFKEVKGLEKEPEGGKRCKVCFYMRLENAAAKAKEFGTEQLASTLTISPHKSAELINELGKAAAKKHGIKYFESNFKKNDGFKKSVELSRKYGLYRQKYCGCIFSME
ncbi:MAG: epoxyqueuosine reductase QueH [Candidatus Goldiibacteriota bacterium]